MDLEKLIEEELSVEQHTPTRFYASDAGRCALYRVWKRKGIRGEQNTHRSALLGRWIHEGIQKLIGKHTKAEFEVEVCNDHIRGRIDALIEKDDGVMLYEFKTIASLKHVTLTPQHHHVMQVQTYIWLLQMPVTSAFIVYVDRNTLEIKTHELLPAGAVGQQDWELPIAGWHGEVKEAQLVTPAGWECEYCPFRKMCPYRR